MHATGIAATLAIAVALMPGGAVATPPTAGAKPHPAPSAQANAAAGEAGAIRIEACTQAAGALIGNLWKGDTTAAVADFDATMRAGLGADKLNAAWQQVLARSGKLQARGAPQSALYKGHVIVALPLHFEKANLNAEVACDADGKIAGFFLRPGTPGPTR